MAEQDPYSSRLSSLTERNLLVKILAELRVLNMLLAQAAGDDTDINELRNDAMFEASTNVDEL